MDATVNPATSQTPPTRAVLGACPHDCPDTCSFVTTVQGDGAAAKAIALHGNPNHPATGGALCTKVSRYLERVHHPERLLYPLKRVGAKGSGQFERIGWDEALNTVAERLTRIALREPQAILPYSYAGTMGLVQGEAMAGRMFHALGTSLLDRTICSAAGGEGLTYTLGGKAGMRTENFAQSKLILIWGSNSITSNLHFWRDAQTAKRAGAKLICIDPRKSETADKCHEHIALLPGTDAALALAMMHELIVNDWLDHDYIERYAVGWPQLRERALQWTPERAAKVCGITPEQIRSLARDYGTTKPAAIRLNYGVQRVKGGGNATRAVACLPALVGAWRHPAGGLLMSSSAVFGGINRGKLQRADWLPRPLPRTVNMVTIGRDLLRPASAEFGPRIEALVVYNSNPVAVAPESGQVARGFAREDLFTVVLEQFHTDTVDYADIVLPATTQLEHWDMQISYGHTDLLLNQPAIPPQGEAKSNATIFRELSARLAQRCGQRFPQLHDACMADSDEALCRQTISSDISPELGVTWDELLTNGFAPLRWPNAPFAQGNFLTPSGKCEFYSERLAAQGLDGLPDHVANHEAVSGEAVSDDGAQPYPLAMISPPARNFLNSSFVNVTSLRRSEGEPVLEMHPDDAAKRGIADGAVVETFNDRGRYRCKAHVTERARPGVVNGLGIWWRKMGLNGTNVNELTSQHLTDMGRGPVFYDCRVEVALAE